MAGLQTNRVARLLASGAFFLLGVMGEQASNAAEAEHVTIFAAASLKNALDDMTPALQTETGIRATAVYAASSALARQIEAGAPADIFISADENWMDYLTGKDLIARQTRRDLLSNALVLIAPKDRPVTLSIGKGFPLAAALGGERLAIANSESVPAGRYAKAALQSLDVWDSVKAQCAETENVRAALALVAAGETPLGIVYKTDAIAELKVAIVGVFPEESHPPIIYPIARVGADPATPNTGSNPEDTVQRALRFLISAASREIFERHGFIAAQTAPQDPAP